MDDHASVAARLGSRPQVWLQAVIAVVLAEARDAARLRDESLAAVDRHSRREDPPLSLPRTIPGILSVVIYSLCLWIFVVDLLLVWALLTFVLNYIPNLGSLISAPCRYSTPF